MKIKLAFLIAGICLFAGISSAQGVRFSSQVLQRGTISTATNAVVLPTTPRISFCAAPANAVPCTNKVTTYTDSTLTTPCSTNAQLVLDGTTTCTSNVDAQNNWGVWIGAGQYTYTITIGTANLGPYFVTVSVNTDATYLRLDSANSPVTGNLGMTGSLTLPKLNSILYLDGTTYSATEVGATIATMYAALPVNGGTIILPPRASCYTMSTAVVFNTASKPVLIDGSGGACINWTPTTGTAFTFNNGDLTLHYRSNGLRNLVVNGPATGTSVGFFLGGTNGAEGFATYGSKINWLSGTGILFGNNTWGTVFDHSTITGAPGINFPTGLTNSGEDIQLRDSFIQGQGSNYTNCALFNGGSGLQLSMFGGSFDDCQLTLSSGVLHLTNVHFENPGMRADSLANPSLIVAGNSTLVSLEILQDAGAAVTKSQEILVTGNTQVTVWGGSFTTNATIPEVLTNSGSNAVFMSPSAVGGFTGTAANGANVFSNTTSTGRTSTYPAYGTAGLQSCTQTSANTFCVQLPAANGNAALSNAAQSWSGNQTNMPLVTPTIGGGSTINLYKTVTDTPGAITVNANTCTDRGVTLSGTLTSAVIIPTANYAIEAGVAPEAAQAVAGTPHYRICNHTVGNITLAAGATFNLAILQ